MESDWDQDEKFTVCNSDTNEDIEGDKGRRGIWAFNQNYDQNADADCNKNYSFKSHKW